MLAAYFKKIISLMKSNYKSVLATILIASSAVHSAQAIQKHDWIFQSNYATYLSPNDPDVARLVRFQSGAPKAKGDLYVARPTGNAAADRDLVQEMRSQPGSPKAKKDQVFMLAPLK